MQLLLGKSYEFGVHEGLNLISEQLDQLKSKLDGPYQILDGVM